MIELIDGDGVFELTERATGETRETSAIDEFLLGKAEIDIINKAIDIPDRLNQDHSKHYI